MFYAWPQGKPVDWVKIGAAALGAVLGFYFFNHTDPGRAAVEAALSVVGFIKVRVGVVPGVWAFGVAVVGAGGLPVAGSAKVLSAVRCAGEQRALRAGGAVGGGMRRGLVVAVCMWCAGSCGARG